jgi:hypothetical protein
MHSKTNTNSARRIAITIVIVALLGGCSQTKGFMSSMRSSPSSSSSDSVILGAPNAEHYLAELYALSVGDPATEAEIYADSEAGAKITPGPQTNLRFALVLATPGHSESNPEIAQSMLRELLAQTELLTPAEISLATIHLKSVERQIVLTSEARRARSSSSRAAATEEEATRQRLATVEGENRRLRSELTDAQEKLDALTSIERSIREQDQ